MKITFIHGRIRNKLEARIYFNDDDKTRYHVVGYLAPEDWDEENKVVKPSCPNYDSLVSKQHKIHKIVTDLYEKQSSLGYVSSISIMKSLKDTFVKKTKIDYNSFNEFSNAFIKDADIKASTKINYEKTIELVQEFDKNLLLSEFNYDLGYRLYNFIIKKYPNRNTAKKHWTLIKTVVGHAHRSLIIGTEQYLSFNKVKAKGQDSNNTYLTPENIKELMDTQFESDKVNLVKDAFLMAYYTSLRKSDILAINSDNLKILQTGHVILSVTPNKTSRYNRKLEYNLSKVFKGAPEKIIFKYMADGNYFQSLNNSSIYNGLKKISDELGWENVNFHTSRHSCLTFIASKTGDIFKVMNYGGITNVDTAQKYIHLSSKLFSIDEIEW